jgi:acylphosphatase
MIRPILTLILLLNFTLAFAQDRKYGDVTVADLQSENDPKYDNEPAVMIFKYIDFQYGEIVRIHERIKIYNTEGLKFSDLTIPHEDLRGLKGATYNLENGKIEVSEVEKESFIEQEIADGDLDTHVVFPKVKVGSIIEYSYKIRDVVTNYINTQAYIPINEVYVRVNNPTYVGLNIVQNPLSEVKLDFKEKSHEFIFTGNNIPAMIPEPYVSNINSFLGKIFIESANKYGHNRLNNWDQVRTAFWNIRDFGYRVREANNYSTEIQRAIGAAKTDLEKATNIYNHIRDNFEWNGRYSRYTSNINQVYRAGEGDLAEINFLLIAWLKQAGFNANPVLIASRKKGYILYPTIVGFDNTICSVEINGKKYLLDASNDKLEFGQLPIEFLNGEGFLVYNLENSELINTLPQDASNDISIIDATLSEDLNDVSGTVKNRLDGYFAMIHRRDYTDYNTDKYTEKLEEEINLLNTSGFVRENLTDIGKPIDIFYNFERTEAVEVINNTIFLKPLLVFGIYENPFKADIRTLPIGFDFPFNKNVIVNIKIPKGYEVESMPEPMSIALEDNIGNLRFLVTRNRDILQASFQLKLNYAVIPPSYYVGIKKLYEEYLNASNAQVVLKKI